MSELNEQSLESLRIDYKDIQIIKTVGSGYFSLVKLAILRGNEVALKMYKKPELGFKEIKNEFKKELRHLCRLSHPNIIGLIGFIKDKNLLAIVQQYAEEGSLYGVLRSELQIEYRLWHVMSWLHQCARGIAYMHSLRPKVIHRDLKSLNLVLSSGGSVLKICDFNSVCDLRSIMTMTKGSVPWMAPEVFSTFKYTEKCDVYSWSIILWELLTRAIPWQEYNGYPLETTLFAVGSGKRPPLINNCPKLIEELMVKCWSHEPNDRPSMREIELIVEQMLKLCPKPESGVNLQLKQNYEECHSIISDIQMATHFNEMNGTDSVDDITSQQSRRINGGIVRSYSDESLISISSLTSRQSIQRSYSEGKEVKHPKSIAATEPLPQDFKKFQNNFSDESELEPRLQHPECQQLMPIFDEHKQQFLKYIKMSAELMALSSQKQQFETIGQNNQIVNCLEDHNQCLAELKINLSQRLEQIKQDLKVKEANANGFEYI